ncbi:metal-sulfur cluster assembly factor [Streptomyces sp. NPDC002758]
MTADVTSAVDRDAVERALERVQDPCSVSMGNPMDIVTMGLIETIEIHGGRVEIIMILTDPNCFFFTTIEKYIADVVMEVPGVTEVDVDISGTTLWSEDLVKKRRLPLLTIPPGDRSE